MKVLVVEDAADLREALLALLASWGYALAAAADGAAALVICAHEVIDLVLLDVALPGCDGQGAAAGCGSALAINRWC